MSGYNRLIRELMNKLGSKKKYLLALDEQINKCVKQMEYRL